MPLMCTLHLHPHMEKTFALHPKILLYIRIFKIWEIKSEDLETLTLCLPHKGRSYIYEILVNSMPLYKHQASSSPKHVQFPNAHTFRVIGDSSFTNLTFEGSLVGTPSVLSSSTFKCRACG